MADAAAQPKILAYVSTKPELTRFGQGDLYNYELYKLTIKEIFNILEGNQEGSVSLDDISLDDLEDYKKALTVIERGFFNLYRGGKVRSKGLEPKTIQPMIDSVGTKLTMAVKFKEKGEEFTEDCLIKLKEGRLLLFVLVEHLEAIKLK